MRFYWPIAKVDAERRMVWGYASTETEDDQGETVTRQALAAALDDYMRFANIREMHQPSAVGVAKEATIDDRGLYLGAKIVDAGAWHKVVEGVYRGFSIGGRVTARDPADRSVITGLTLTEISVVDRPANPETIFDCWKLSIGLATGGTMANTAAAPRPPAQIWDCGIAGHRHLAKAEAMACAQRDGLVASKAAAGPSATAVGPGGPAGDPHDTLDYADPGFLTDGRRRYPIDTESHIRAAWAFIHQAHNARRYTADQLNRIRARIAAAWRARIDPNGPPAAGAEPGRATDTTRKSLADTGQLAQIIVELAMLHDCLAGEAATEAATEADSSPLPQRLQEIIVQLCDFLEALVAEETAELVEGGDAPSPGAGLLQAVPGIAAMALAGKLRKARRPDNAPLADGLAKLADAIVPRLDALQQRVDEIARTPLPPQTVARGFAGIAKREDGGAVFSAAEDIVAALARMSEEERTLTLIKAAHANPIRPLASRPQS
ncbi:MAG TPA: DUF6582 domain-containing protein [Stellaceae bacterium]|nr:DUF6582 domain-containing protein [Stellaceae bacterium]